MAMEPPNQYQIRALERMRYDPKLDLLYCLRRIFNQPSILVITGEWKSGKTDTALLIAYDLLIKRLKIFKKFGTNIRMLEPEKTPEIEYVADLDTLHYFLHKDSMRKIVCIDEAIKFGYKRSPMSKMNIGLIQIMTELSKGHANGIYCAQDPTMVDKDLLNIQFCKALIVKQGFYKRDEIELHSYLIPNSYRHFTGLPPTSLKFDPYEEADFSVEGSPLLLIPEVEAFSRWASGESMYIIGRDPEFLSKMERTQPLHPEAMRRILQRVAKAILTASHLKADEVTKALGDVKKEP